MAGPPGSESFVMQDVPASEKDDVDSLPSISSSLLDSDDEDDAQEEWERSLQQLQMLLTMVVIPFAGKYFGRQFAYWSWARYMEWAHDIEVQWSGKWGKAKHRATGAAVTAATL